MRTELPQLNASNSPEWSDYLLFHSRALPLSTLVRHLLSATRFYRVLLYSGLLASRDINRFVQLLLARETKSWLVSVCFSLCYLPMNILMTALQVFRVQCLRWNVHEISGCWITIGTWKLMEIDVFFSVIYIVFIFIHCHQMLKFAPAFMHRRAKRSFCKLDTILTS